MKSTSLAQAKGSDLLPNFRDMKLTQAIKNKKRHFRKSQQLLRKRPL